MNGKKERFLQRIIISSALEETQSLDDDWVSWKQIFLSTLKILAFEKWNELQRVFIIWSRQVEGIRTRGFRNKMPFHARNNNGLDDSAIGCYANGVLYFGRMKIN